MSGEVSDSLDSRLGYWQASRRPLESLLFVLPMLVIYETGTLLLGTAAIRNGVDIWLRQLLELLGFGQYFLLPLLTCSLLLAWHHLKHHSWKIEGGYLPWMLAESAGLALLLLAIAHAQASLLKLEVAAGGAGMDLTARQVVAYFGAGIYEELLFRLMLIPVLIMLLRVAAPGRIMSVVGAVVLSSLIFSLAHYDIFIPGGDTLELYSFMFRLSAGMVFAAIFAIRGFGIAAGSHALYDVLVALS